MCHGCIDETFSCASTSQWSVEEARVRGRKAAGGLRLAAMSHRYFAADPNDACNIFIHKIDSVKYPQIVYNFVAFRIYISANRQQLMHLVFADTLSFGNKTVVLNI